MAMFECTDIGEDGTCLNKCVCEERRERDEFNKFLGIYEHKVTWDIDIENRNMS
jgi:hypothetical protein